MAIRLKSDFVRPGNGIGLLLGIIIVESVYRERGIECVITSLNDSDHSLTSLHYADQAVDFRTNNIPVDNRLDMWKEIKSRLNVNYDFIMEATHYHLEFQPRGPR